MDATAIIGNISREKFRISANKLLNECFILKRHKDTQSDYAFILNNRQVFADYFELLGYELIIQEDFGVICLNNTFGTGRVHLTKMESVIALILRLLYIEKRRSLSALEEVVITIDEIYDRYNMLRMSVSVNKVMMRTIMGHFKRLHLVNNLDPDMSAYDTRIMIFASIMLAIPADNIEEVYRSAKERLEKYQNGGDRNESDDEETDED